MKKTNTLKPSLFSRFSKKRNLLITVLIFVVIGGGTLVFTQAAGQPVYSVRSGNWSDPNTWQNKHVPVSNSRVSVRKGNVVVLDTNSQIRGMDVADGAEVRFSPTKSIQLLTNKNVVIHGKLTMVPATNNQVHLLRFINVNNDRFQGGTMDPISTDVGLWVVDAGQLNINGAAKTGWTNLAGTLNANASNGIKLKTTPTNWQPGDKITIMPTQPPLEAVGNANYTGFDENTVKTSSSGVISLASGVAREHPQVNNHWTAEVANLTRNVKIEGTASGYSHIFIRSTKPQTVRYAELTYMGAPSKNANDDDVLGRYALHFHHADNGSVGSLVEGVVVHKGLNHAFVAHASNGVTFRDTVAYDTREDAYWWDPTANKQAVKAGAPNNASDNILYDHALAAKVNGGGTSLAGFKLTESNNDNTNEVRNSVAVGIVGHTQSSGFAWRLGGTAWKFNNNLAHNNAINGIFVWQNTSNDHLINGFDAYYNRHGIQHGAYKNHFHYQNLNLYGNRDSGLQLEATSNDGLLRFDNITIDGGGITQIGINTCCHQLPGVNYPTVISNGTVKNVTYGVYMDHGRSKDADWLQLNNVTVSAVTPYLISSSAGPSTSLEVINGTQHFCYTTTSQKPTSKFIASLNIWQTTLTTPHVSGTDTSTGC